MAFLWDKKSIWAPWKALRHTHLPRSYIPPGNKSDAMSSGDRVAVFGYHVEIIQRLPENLTGVAKHDMVQLMNGSPEIKGYRTCIVGRYPYFVHVLGRVGDGGGDKSHQYEQSPPSGKTVSTLPLYSPQDLGSPLPSSLSPGPPAYEDKYAGIGTNPAVFHLDTDAHNAPSLNECRLYNGGRNKSAADKSFLSGTLQEQGLLFMASTRPHGSCASGSPPSSGPDLREYKRPVDPGLTPEILPNRSGSSAQRTPRLPHASPLLGLSSVAQLPDSVLPSLYHPKPRQVHPVQFPIGTPYSHRLPSLVGQEKLSGARLPLGIPSTGVCTTPVSFQGDGCPGGRKYTAELVSEEDEYIFPTAGSTDTHNSPQSAQDFPNTCRAVMSGVPSIRRFPVNLCDNVPAGCRPALPMSGDQFRRGYANSLPMSSWIKEIDAKQPLESFTSRLSSFPRIFTHQRRYEPVRTISIAAPRPIIGHSLAVRHLEELVEVDDELTDEYYMISPKTRYLHEMPTENDVLDANRGGPNIHNRGLDRFLAERRLLSPGPPDDGVAERNEGVSHIEDDDSSDEGMFDDFPICEMSIAMGLHERGTRRRHDSGTHTTAQE